MAVLVFSGGHFIRVPTEAQGAVASLSAGPVVPRPPLANGYVPLISGDATVYVNPAQVAYIVEDKDFDDTFPQGADYFPRK